MSAESHAAATASPSTFTGERVTPVGTPEALVRESHMRYLFASDFVRGADVLDVACGSGMGSDLMTRLGARTCVGLDLSLDAVTYAARRYPRCSFAVCDATRLAARESSADCIVSLETLEHLPDPEGFVAQCARVLRPGGRFVVSTPNRPVSRWLGPNPFHVREFTRDELLQLLGRHFSECELFGQNWVFYPSFIVQRLIMRLLAALRVKEALKRLLKPSWSMPSTRDEYDPNVTYSECEVRPYVERAWERPLYFVAVARNHFGEQPGHSHTK